MTEVRLTIGWQKARSLGDVPFTELDTVIPTLKNWGLKDDDDNFLDTDNLCAQFTFKDGDAFFEVMYE